MSDVKGVTTVHRNCCFRMCDWTLTIETMQTVGEGYRMDPIEEDALIAQHLTEVHKAAICQLHQAVHE